jgi:hypothetical protein
MLITKHMGLVRRQDGRKSPELRGACGEALAAFLEGSAEACGELLALDGIPYLIHLLNPSQTQVQATARPPWGGIYSWGMGSAK